MMAIGDRLLVVWSTFDDDGQVRAVLVTPP